MTPRHDKFISAIANSPIHIIATMRGKDQYEVEKDDRGKVSVKKLGVGAKQREGFEYEFTSTFMLDRDTNLAKAQKDNTHIFEDDPMVKLTEEHGQRIIEWANSGEGYTPRVIVSDDKVVIDEEALKDKKDEISTLVNSLKECGVDRETISEAIKMHHKVNGKSSANYNSIKIVDVADDVLSELNKLIVKE